MLTQHVSSEAVGSKRRLGFNLDRLRTVGDVGGSDGFGDWRKALLRESFVLDERFIF